MKFIKHNLLLLLYVVCFLLIEFFANIYTDGLFYLSFPIYTLFIILFFISIILLFKKGITRLIVSSVFLIGQIILDTILIFLYDSNGTIFEWSLMNQRNDAYGTLEQFNFQYKFIFISLLITLIFVLVNHFNNQKNIQKDYKLSKYLIVLCIIVILSFPIKELMDANREGYSHLLYSKTYNQYQEMGIFSSTIYQTIKGNVKLNFKEKTDIEEFIYKESIDKSSYNGVSKGNNLILILVESLEWYPFTLYSEHNSELFPNLTPLINDSIVASNYHQKEKTDVSEAFSVLGNYPMDKYVNYDYATNSYPFSLANLIENDSITKNQNIKINSFHHNYGDFYNRYTLHQSWGFERLYGINEMKEYGVEDTWNYKKGERNLDSIAFNKMKEIMFPNDERFFSFILSFSMHGFYKERANLKEYYDKLDSLQILSDTSNINDEYLKTYIAATMDFDKAIGEMMKYLKENDMLDNTTIILYPDHNTYYNKLSYYVKNIDEKYNTELFRLPFIIYDKKLSEQYKKDNETLKLTKSISATDIVPTVLDIFGINGWKNLYLGSSIFTDTQNISYSRNYKFFMTDKLIATSINNIVYKSDNLKQSDIDSFEKNAKIYLNKLDYIDNIYRTDYFKDHKYKY